MKEKRSRDILAIVTTDKKHLGGGKGQVFLMETPEQCQSFTQELARAIQGEVIALSNGIYLILDL